jgi:hypothetical protein
MNRATFNNNPYKQFRGLNTDNVSPEYVETARESNHYFNQCIEISNRGSGKTYRLISQLTDFLTNHNKPCILMVLNHRTAKNILKTVEEIIEPEFKNRIKNVRVGTYRDAEKACRGIDLDNTQKYFDEFPAAILEDIVVLDNLYACTSLET